MISIYPEPILYVESDVLNLKQASCGIADKIKGNQEFWHIQKTILMNFLLFDGASD